VTESRYFEYLTDLRKAALTPSSKFSFDIELWEADSPPSATAAKLRTTVDGGAVRRRQGPRPPGSLETRIEPIRVELYENFE